jgi:tetratricopeptide (TPR) repeat protein
MVNSGSWIDKLSFAFTDRVPHMDWDTSSFGNDGAQEWLHELAAAKTGDSIRQAIEIVDDSDNFIDAADAERAIAAGEVIAASRGAAGTLPDEATGWLKAQRYKAPDVLVAKAVAVITRILGNSELRDLWDGTEARESWLTSVRDLQTRLSKIEKEKAPVNKTVSPADVESCFNEAVEHVAVGAHEAAVQKYDQVIELDPNFVVGYIGRGTSFLALGQFEDALADFNRAIDLGPEITEAYYLRAQAYFQTEKIGRAIADLTILINMDQTRADAYFMRGLANGEMARHEKAIEDFTKAIELDAESSKAFLHRSQAYERLGRFDLAGKDMKQYERLSGITRTL